MKNRPKVDKTKLLKGLNNLGHLWKRGLIPENLERHYMLFWFLQSGGNILEAARRLKIHRNTIQGYFLRFGYSKRAVKLRHEWNALREKHPRKSEADLFHLFYHSHNGKPRFSAVESDGLVLLWNTGFPMKVLKAHFLLWAVRSEKNRAWIADQLDFSNRHQLRIFGQLNRPASREFFWLSCLQLKKNEWFLRRGKKPKNK
jgi:hypothetical protein